jgi:hypothetical protein
VVSAGAAADVVVAARRGTVWRGDTRGGCGSRLVNGGGSGFCTMVNCGGDGETRGCSGGCRAVDDGNVGDCKGGMYVDEREDNSGRLLNGGGVDFCSRANSG